MLFLLNDTVITLDAETLAAAKSKTAAAPLRFEAILYHTSFEVSLQYHDVDGSQGGSASVALQDPAAGSAAVYACDGSRPVAAAQAVCFFDPRFPAGSGGVNDPIFADGFEGAPARR